MNFTDIPAGQSLFVDANVLVNEFGPDPSFGSPSRSLLQRTELGKVNG